MESIKRFIIQTNYKTKRYLKELLYPISKNGKFIKSLENKHLGKRCFIIGNGPSLRADDLDKLKNEITFAFNRIYYIFDQTDWRPTYYCSEDDKTIFNSMEEMNSLNIENKFFPVNFPWDYKIHFRKANYYIFKFGDRNQEPKFSENILRGIYWGNTVAYTALQLAVYMGFKEIYLIGVDHNFSKMKNDNGDIIIDEEARDYFIEKYNSDKEELYIPNIETSTRAFLAAKKFADKNSIRIYNATRGGKLEVFERFDFDKINF
ncbi:hypothetical protein QFZ87_001500 [Bacillus sp. SLBN-46]|uniref:6-hydroxymethylpterin diphosphokinase MptE-like protein n=1 Tax=Bacillus sp. SLBN-46 TaxID=3042283 RepID=UPI0028560015|nr:6-hydroxymethylpterin diphosphokinase MptE-like protein [Bacillus sp. SLBN-46]MDR6121903.1 hypothetical protein [Bacillus sp. SLBN-46]